MGQPTPGQDRVCRPTPAIEAAAIGRAAPEAGITADPVADMRAKAATEQERIAAVQKVCGDAHAAIAAKAIAEGWDVNYTICPT